MLCWSWSDKCGEATIAMTKADGSVQEHVLNLYEGNAYLIMLAEWEEDGKNMYNMYSFWADKAHMKNCLGLNKKEGYTDNMYARKYERITKVRLNKAKCRNYRDICTALAQAFDDITIEICKE